MSVWGNATSAVVAATTSPSQVESPSSTPAVPEVVPEINLYQETPKVDSVHLDGLVVLQIIKHCNDNLPSCVAGSLLGLENGDVLEITNSFPSPSAENEGSNTDDYQIEMMKNLREVNVDNNKVGWYQSALFGSFCSASIIEYQYQYQDMLGPNAICIIYDPSQTLKGSLSIRAFRLTSSFCELYKAGEYTKETLSKLEITSSNIMEEIPIQIHNPEIINCWIFDQQKKTKSTCDFDRLDLSTNPFLENSLQQINAWSDELAQEHIKYQGYERALAKQRSLQQQWLQKRREENRIRRENGQPLLPEEDPNALKSLSQPSRLEGLLITKQIQTYCDQINRFAGKSFPRLFIAGNLHKE